MSLGHRERGVSNGWCRIKIKKGWRTVAHFPYAREWRISESPPAEVVPIKPRIVA